MTSGPHTVTAATTTEEHALRLRLKPKGPTTGYVDGAWWPRSADLVGELPELFAVLAVRLGRIERVTFHLGDVSEPPRRIVYDGERVRLEGFRSQRAGTVTVIGASDRHRVTLLTVPSDTDPDVAHDVQMTAAHRDNTDTVETLRDRLK
jgi:hypothetical protein